MFTAGFSKTAAGRHEKRISKAIEGKKDIHITYKKLNGRTVKRKVTPYQIKGKVLVGHDHKRKDFRSYRLDRLKGVKNA